MNPSSSCITRLIALTRKETRQLLRDRSNLAVGLLLPIVLILLFGYGLSFDLTHARIAVVQEQRTPQSEAIVSALQGSRYLYVQHYPTQHAAETAFRRGDNDAILRIPSDFAAGQHQGRARLQLILNGTSTNVASSVQSYVSGALTSHMAKMADRENRLPAGCTINIEQRIWFNASSNSTWFIVPGLIVLILTLIGAFLTGLLIARERERGTLEPLFVTPVRPLELVLAKLTPYMVLGTLDLVVCLLAAHFLFEVPMRGSLWAVMVASLLYLVVSLALGLTISGFASGQFLASQIALLTSFLPAMMLSGFVFDIRNLPVVIQAVSQILPATHFMTLLKTLLLGGDDWWVFFRECAILSLFALALINASRIALRKRLR